MNRSEVGLRKPPTRIEPTGGSPRNLWAIVLAGGDGVRLRPLTRRVCGDERPKQYAVLLGSRSLLRLTLDRVALAISPERTVVVTRRDHARYVAAEFSAVRAPRVLIQPADRGTAAGILFPAHWIAWQDADATVAVFPSDHFVIGERAFMAQIMELATAVQRHPHMIVLLGAEATTAETEYGWIEPGERVDSTRTGPIFRVRRFWEKPSPETAAMCLARGWLWNTFVLVAKVRALLDVGRDVLPLLDDRFSQVARYLGAADEAWAIEQAYLRAPSANFSREILEACALRLAVSKSVAAHWSDWGTPDRVLHSLRKARISPPWLTALGDLA